MHVDNDTKIQKIIPYRKMQFILSTNKMHLSTITIKSRFVELSVKPKTVTCQNFRIPSKAKVGN